MNRRGNYRGRGQFFNFGRRTANKRPKLTSVQIPNTSFEESGYSSFANDAATTRQTAVASDTQANSEQYPGWNLYFPEESTFTLLELAKITILSFVLQRL